MKTVNILFTMAITAIIMLVGCQKEQFKNAKDPQNYYASVETFGTATKTALADRTSVVWSSEDRIAVYGNNDNTYDPKIKIYQILDSYVGSAIGEFTYIDDFLIDGASYYTSHKKTLAFYPFNEELSFIAYTYGAFEISGVSFPSVQKYSVNSFSNESFPMVAVTTDKNLSFKNVGSVFKLSLKGSYSVSSITLTSNNDEPLSGSAVVTVNSNGIPSVHMSEDASGSVTLVCETAVQLSEETATDFYISIPPTNFYRGLMITVTDDKGREKVKKTDKINVNKVSRSEIINMPVLHFNYNDFPSQNDRWVNLGLSVLWASYNLGADSPEEYGGFYAWGETEVKSEYSTNTYLHNEVYYPNPEDNPNQWEKRAAYIGSEISGTEYDAAFVNWGNGARLPTQDEIAELIDNCHHTSVIYNGIKGTRVIGPNGNTIFLPKAGSMYFDEHRDEGYLGAYMTGTYFGKLDEGDNYGYKYTLMVNDDGWFSRPGPIVYGASVRPVKDK